MINDGEAKTFSASRANLHLIEKLERDLFGSSVTHTGFSTRYL